MNSGYHPNFRTHFRQVVPSDNMSGYRNFKASFYERWYWNGTPATVHVRCEGTFFITASRIIGGTVGELLRFVDQFLQMAAKGVVFCVAGFL